jgi:flagellar biosynthesis protein FlhF
VCDSLLQRESDAIEDKLVKQFGPRMNADASGRAQRLNAMRTEIAASIKTTGPITLSPGTPTVVALVGPTGVGKTTTLAKIASQYKHYLKKRVAFISLDNVKLGAREQIEVISREHQIPFRTAGSSEELKEAIAAFYDQDLILIDTGGRSQYQTTEVVALADLLTADSRIKIYLALSATTKDVDCMGIVKQFSRMPIKGLIFTKLDETIAYGMMVTVCERSRVPISYLTNGQKVPRDLQIAESGEIAKSILMQHNSKACTRIREMATA